MVDDAAAKQGITRSDLIRIALTEKLGITDMVALETNPKAKQASEPSISPAMFAKIAREHPRLELYEAEMLQMLIDMERNQVQ